MRDYIVKFWSLVSVLLLTFLLVGCDTEFLDYEDDDTYALLDRGAMAPVRFTDVISALEITEAGAPTDSLPWAYSVTLDFLGVTVKSSDVSLATFKVHEVAEALKNAGMQFDAIPPVDKVIELVQAAIQEYNSKPGLQYPNTSSDFLENTALIAFASSLASRDVTMPGQVNGDIELTHGDFLILLTCIYQSHDQTMRNNNTLAYVVNEVLEDNGIPIAVKGLPPLEVFIESATGTAVSAPHQGELVFG